MATPFSTATLITVTMSPILQAQQQRGGGFGRQMDANGDELPILESTTYYCSYVEETPEDLLYAHVYVRYLGDLKGGQMIAKRVPGSGMYYKFDSPDELEVKIRSKLREDHEFVEECKKCFTFAQECFEDLKKYIESNIDIV